MDTFLAIIHFSDATDVLGSKKTPIPGWGVALFVAVSLVAAAFVAYQLMRRR